MYTRLTVSGIRQSDPEPRHVPRTSSIIEFRSIYFFLFILVFSLVLVFIFHSFIILLLNSWRYLILSYFYIRKNDQ